MKQYKWETISMLIHFIGAVIACVFAIIFPDKSDMVIAIDAWKNDLKLLLDLDYVLPIGPVMTPFLGGFLTLGIYAKKTKIINY